VKLDLKSTQRIPFQTCGQENISYFMNHSMNESIEIESGNIEYPAKISDIQYLFHIFRAMDNSDLNAVRARTFVE
jgi:hypothetical protein